MKARWLAILCALAVGAPACGDTKKKSDKAEKDDDDDKKEKKEKKDDKDGKDKKSGDKPTDTPSTAGASTPGDDEPAPPPAPTEAPKPPMTKDALSTFLKDESAKMTPDAYESLLLGMADC